MLNWFKKKNGAPQGAVPAQVRPASTPAGSPSSTQVIPHIPTPPPVVEKPAEGLAELFKATEETKAPNPDAAGLSELLQADDAASAPAAEPEKASPIKKIPPFSPIHAKTAEKSAEAPAMKPEAPATVPIAPVGKPSSLHAVQPVAPRADALKQKPKLLYRALLAGMYDAVIITDPKGHVIETNSRVRDLFLFGPDDLWDAPVSKLIRGITPQLLERLRSNVSEKRHVLLDATCNRLDTSTFPAEVAISGITLINEGDFVFTVRNVEKRRNTFNALRSYQNATLTSPVPTLLTDRSGIVTFGNNAVAELCGVEQKAVSGRTLVEYFGDETIAGTALKAVMEGKPWTGKIPFIGKGNQLIDVEVDIVPDTIGKGKITGAIVYLQPA